MAAAAELQATAGWRRRLARGRGRWLGTLAAAVLALSVLIPDPAPRSDAKSEGLHITAQRLWVDVLWWLRFASFDQYQRWFPRQPKSHETFVIVIDDAALLEAKEQWPWPRDRLAALIDSIVKREPKVVVVDMMLVEPDRSSPERIATALRHRDPVAAQYLEKLQTNDEILAGAFARAPLVLGAVGVELTQNCTVAAAPSRVIPPPPPLTTYPGVLCSLTELDSAALGRGLMNVDFEHGIVRRVPAVAYIGEIPVLGLGAEAIRVAENAQIFSVEPEEPNGLSRVRLGAQQVTAQRDGRVWLHFARAGAMRSMSAADILTGKDDPKALRGKVVFVGVTALGLLDHHMTPLGERVPGTLIHAQFVENILEGSELRRPAWMPFVEALLLAAAAIVIIVFTPRAKPRWSFLLVIACASVMLVIGIAAFLGARTLVDIAAPGLGMILVYGVMLAGTLAAANLERAELATRLRLQREAAARVAGELEAARRIQTGILPTRESALGHERRVDIFTHMKPAREVGGDLYDFYLLPDDRILVIQGDVSGKGLSAAMFMAVTKAVAKSAVLRERMSVAEMMSTFNREIARENPEQMFVTLAAIVLDLGTGELEYCNAGHEPPLVFRATGEPLVLDDAGGPPLCVVDDFPYDQASARMEPHDILVLASDGITEAMNEQGSVYGRERLKDMLHSPDRRSLDLAVLGNEIVASVKRYESSAEPSDDQTLVLVQWRGR